MGTHISIWPFPDAYPDVEGKYPAFGTLLAILLHSITGGNQQTICLLQIDHKVQYLVYGVMHCNIC